MTNIQHYIQSPHPLSSEPRHLLRNLKRLFVDHDGHWESEAPTSTDLSILLLSSPALVKLTLNGLHELTDTLIERVLTQSHGFPELKSVKLSFCHELTRQSIDLLLNCKSPITTINLVHCGKLSQENVREWKQMALSINWDLTILNPSNNDE